MKLIIWIAALLMIANVIAADDSADIISYSIILNYDSGKITLKDLAIIQSNPTPVSDGNEYRAQVVSFLGSVLYETSFNVQLLILNAAEEEGEVSIEAASKYLLTKRDIDLILPWHPNGQKIAILKNGTLMLEIDVSRYAQCNENAVCDANETLKFCPGECTCGNGVCEPEENYVKCQRDCKSGQKDGVCDKKADSLCDPDCGMEEDIDCIKEEIPPENASLEKMPLEIPPESKVIPKKTILLYAGTAIALVVICIVIQFLKKRKNSDKTKESKE